MARRARQLLLAVAVASMVGFSTSPALAAYNNPDTDWMRDGKYGLYFKYLNWTPRDTEPAEFNRWVNAFDVNTFAESVELTGASWVIWGMGRAWFNSPNATLEGFVGDFTSDRDLPLEIANALQQRGIRFMLYAAADKTQTAHDDLGKTALGWGFHNDKYTSTYVNNWADVLQVWSDRYGTKVSGWWIDHAYPGYAASRTAWGSSNPELAIYRSHLLSGNANGIIAFNHGGEDLQAHTPENDYRSGHERGRLTGVATSRWWHGLQWHYLSRLGPGLWGSAGLKYGTQELIDYVNENNRHEGVNTFSVFIYSQPGESAEGIVKSPGNLSTAQLQQLSALKDGLLEFVDSASTDVSFVGTWERRDDGMDFRGSTKASNQANASAELVFTGTGVEVVVRKGRNGGLVDVELDGNIVLDDFDTYSSTTAYKQIIYSTKSLSAGSHRVRLVATGRKRSSATAADAMLDNFAVTRATDTERPRVVSVTSDASHPTKDSFKVTIDFVENVRGLRAEEITVSNGSGSNFAGSGASYTLDIAPTAGLEGEVTVRIPANAAVDGANNGNLEASETFAVDTSAPVMQTAQANQAVLTLVYGEAFDPLSVPPASAFTLTGGGAQRRISSSVVNGGRVVLAVDPPVSYGETGLQLSYSAPSNGALADALGNKVPSFTNQAVTNASPGTTRSNDTWIAAAAAFSVQEGDTAVATLTATEAATAAGDPVWWIPSSAAGGPDGGKFVLSRAGVLSFAAAKDFEAPDDANADGSYQIKVHLSIGALTDAADVTVTLTDRNEAPTADAGPDQPHVGQGTLATLTGVGSDPDAGDTLTYAWTQTGTPAVTLSDAALASPTFTAPSNLTGEITLSFTLRITDSSGLYHEDSVSVTVSSHPPFTATFSNAPARHDGSTQFSVDLRFSEQVGLSYTAFTLGLFEITGGTVQRATRLVPRSSIAWRIPVTPDGDGDVVITLPANRACGRRAGPCTPDGRKLAVTASVTVLGLESLEPPEIISATAFTAQEGETAVGTLAATDADTAAADLVWTIPSGTAGGVDAGKFALTAAGVLTFAAAKDYEAPDDANTDGAYQVSVQVSDGGRTDTADLTVTLTNVNEVPTADAGSDQSGIAPGAQVALGGSGTDPDAGDALSYAWTQSSGTSVTLTGAAGATASFTVPSGAADEDEFTFKLKVTDAAGLYGEDSTTVTTGVAAPAALEISSASTFSVAEGATAVATLAATDEDTLASGLTWSIPSGADAGKFALTAAGVLTFAAAKDFEDPDDANTDGAYQVTVRVSDGGRTDTADLTVTLTNVNEAPTADAGADQSGVAPGAQVTLAGSGTDPDTGDSLTYAWTQTAGTSVILTDGAVATASFTVPSGAADEDEFTFTLKVTDADGLFHEDPVAVTVGDVLAAAFENAPAAHDGSTPFDLQLRFSEEVDISYTAFTNGLFTVTGGAVGRASRLAPPSNIGWTFPVTPSGDGDLVVTLPANRACDRQSAPCARDGRRLSRSASVTVTGPAPAASPEIASASSLTVAEGTTAVATLRATDEDTAAPGLSWSIPTGTAGGADRGEFSITSAGALRFAAAKDFEDPDDANTDGAYQVRVRVSDGGRADTADLTVTLTNVNEAPTADAGSDQSGVAPGARVTLSGTGTDPDAGEALSYAWTQTGGTSGTLTGDTTATATFTVPSGAADEDEFTFKLRVTDAAGLYDEDAMTVTAAVAELEAPEIGSLSAFSVAEGATAVATLTATDEDTLASGLTWSIPSGADAGKFALTAAGVLTFAAAKDFEDPDDANTDGAYQVRVRVSDGGRADTADLTVTLTNVNEAPTADAGSDQSGIAPGARVTLSGSGTDPDAGDALSYAWTQTGGTSGTLTGGSTATATFTVPSGAADEDEFTFKLRVTDAAGLYDEDAMTVTAAVAELAAPEIGSLSAFSVAEGATAVATLTATDEDTPASGLTWSIPSGADAGKFALTAAGVLTFAAAKDFEDPDDANTDGAYQVTVRVSDGGRTDTADLTVTLTNVNEAPTADAGSDQSGIAPGAQVTLGGSGTDPDTGDSLTYAWTQTGGTSGTLTNTAGATARFTVPGGATNNEQLTFKLRVTDAAGLYHEDRVVVTVQASDESSPTEPDVEWGERLPDRDILLPRGSKPTGLWSDGTTLWVVSDWSTGQVLTYSLDEGELLDEGEVTLPDGVTPGSIRFRLTDSGFPAGLWSDGTTLWAADYFGGIRAYRLVDGTRLETEDLPDDVLTAAGNNAPTGLWSDGETLWVTDHWQYQVFAYRLSDKARVADKEFDLWDRTTPYGGFGLWSDGETALVGPAFYAFVIAHSLATGEQQAEQIIDLSAQGVRNSNGLWSDGETLWVANALRRRIHAYAVPGLVRASAPNSLRTFSVRVQTQARGMEGSAGESTPDTPIAIPDPALRALIAPALGKAPGESISLREIAALTALDAREAGVADLTGLNHAVNLEELDLGRNPVSDLRILESLPKLRVLNLDGVGPDLWSLADLNALKELSLRENGLADVSALAALNDLAVLDLGENRIETLYPLLGKARLHTLILDGNHLSDLSALAEMTALKHLVLRDNSVTNLWPLAALTALETLNLEGNRVRDLTPLNWLRNLRQLHLEGYPDGDE